MGIGIDSEREVGGSVQEREWEWRERGGGESKIGGRVIGIDSEREGKER